VALKLAVVVCCSSQLWAAVCLFTLTSPSTTTITYLDLLK
jgi:hypothetical protein